MCQQKDEHMLTLRPALPRRHPVSQP
jgi:hypothetical protein